MDAKIIEMAARFVTLERADENTAGDEFLLQEGLALLADFRSISDATTRASIADLVQRLAKRNV